MIYITTTHINRLDEVTVLVDEVFLTKRDNGTWINKDKLSMSQWRAFQNYIKALEPLLEMRKIEREIDRLKKQIDALADLDINAHDYGQLSKFYEKKLTELTNKLNRLKK